MLRFKKGELKYYLKLTPKELKEFVNSFPEKTDIIRFFLENYDYNYLKKAWVKTK